VQNIITVHSDTYRVNTETFSADKEITIYQLQTYSFRSQQDLQPYALQCRTMASVCHTNEKVGSSTSQVSMIDTGHFSVVIKSEMRMSEANNTAKLDLVVKER